MAEFIKSIRSAFSSWWALLGIFGASVTGFNVTRRMLDVSLSSILANAFSRYELLVHAPIRSLFAWIRLPQPPSWAIDAWLLWLLIGGVVLRTALVVRNMKQRQQWYSKGLLKELTQPGRLNLVRLVVLCLLCWPLVFHVLAKYPLFQILKREDLRSRVPHHVNHGTYLLPNYVLMFDMRVVAATQAFAAAACIAAWFVLNALTEG